MTSWIRTDDRGYSFRPVALCFSLHLRFMSLYAYCLSDEIAPGALDEITGMQGKRARAVVCESIGAVVSDFEGERAEVTRENVLAHDRVIRSALAAGATLPFRFGMVVSRSQLDSFIAARRASLLSQLERVRGSVEMSVKIIWDAQTVKRAAREMADDIKGAGRASAAGPGADFLLAKRREILGDNALKREAERIAAWLGETLGGSVRETILRMLPSETMALTASHLVEQVRMDEYRQRLSQAISERDDLRFLTSGAWPPYSFSNLDS
jgi:gas vesicle protein GvpL/GvpF